MTASGKTLEFWYDFASPYSYLSALRIEDMAGKAGVQIQWKPFLLGPIFEAQGWTTSPFNLYPAKGRYMIRDMMRLAKQRGVLFHTPTPFPQNGLIAARIALMGAADGWTPAFSKAVFKAQFADRAPIAEMYTLGVILDQLGFDSKRILACVGLPETKQELRDQTARALHLDIFGAPMFRTSDGELFWGDDRLDQALDWAAAL